MNHRLLGIGLLLVIGVACGDGRLQPATDRKDSISSPTAPADSADDTCEWLMTSAFDGAVITGDWAVHSAESDGMLHDVGPVPRTGMANYYIKHSYYPKLTADVCAGPIPITAHDGISLQP